jgi:hypothetical protein
MEIETGDVVSIGHRATREEESRHRRDFVKGTSELLMPRPADPSFFVTRAVGVSR